jgi:hypothetical protein
MKKLLAVIFAVTFIIGFSGSVVFAGNGIDINGKHYNVNIIGKKKGAVNGDNSNGSSIFIPLKNVMSRDGMVCDVDGAVLVDDTAPTWLDSEPIGTKIYFVAGDSFAILDRDGTDSNGAKIQVPVDPTTKEILFDIYIRVLGKPYGCMNIGAYAYDANQGLWFWAGSVYLNRTKGKQVFINANDLFDVWWCTVDTTTDTCLDNAQEISVFSDVFDSYFWNILNDGVKLVQVRIYPRSIQ